MSEYTYNIQLKHPRELTNEELRQMFDNIFWRLHGYTAESPDFMREDNVELNLTIKKS